MKAHLSNVKFSKEYKIKLCPQVPPSVSAAMVSKLQEVEGKKGKKRCFDERVNEEMKYELAEIAFLDYDNFRKLRCARLLDYDYF